MMTMTDTDTVEDDDGHRQSMTMMDMGTDVGDGEVSGQARVPGLVHLAHAAASDAAPQPVGLLQDQTGPPPQAAAIIR